jgi:hypothetical protein
MIGRKVRRRFNNIGRKIARKSNKIGRKLSKAGNIVGRIAPFLSAVPVVGSALSLGATAAGETARSVGGALQSRNAGQAGKSLAEMYAAAKSRR